MRASTKIAELSEEERRAMEAWLDERARTWSDGSLESGINELRSMLECPWRLVAATLLAKLDLKRQWQAGRLIALENYLATYPELGGKEGVAADLIVAEIKAKSRAGIAFDVEDYIRSYPNQSAEVQAKLAEARSAAAGSTRKMRPQSPSTPRPFTAEAPASTAAPPPPTATPQTAKSAPASRPSSMGAPSPPTAAPQAALPQMFGRYRIEKQLGQGGMGSVYKAFDTELHRDVALKVPQFGPDEGAEVLERFKQEARAAATLRHANLCQVYDVGAIGGTHFLTMEFIGGQSLEGYAAKQQQGVSPRFIALIMTKLARALKTAHAKNVIHRDLKPSNIMLRDADGALEPVIVDFGLARRLDPGTARLTQSGLVIGTWQYMTPEQLCGEPDALGPGCDIYALGVIMYELLTGRLPYDAPGQVVRGNATAPSSLRPGVDPRLEEICLKAMAPTSAARYASMGDLASALTDYLRAGTDKSPEIKAAIAPSGPTPRQTKLETPLEREAPAARQSMSPGKLIAGGLAAGVAFIGVSIGVRSLLSSGSGKTGSAAPDPAAIAKAPTSDAAKSAGSTASSSERLFQEAWSAIRQGKYADAQYAVSRYLSAPNPAKKDEARVLSTDLERVLSTNDAKTWAKGLGRDELDARLDQGVKDMAEVIHTPELRAAYSASLLEACTQEKNARALVARKSEIAAKNRLGAIAKKAAGRPRPESSLALGPGGVPAHDFEPGFKAIYNGQSFDGWETSIRKDFPPSKGGTRYVRCPPANVVRRDGSSLVTALAVGILTMDKVRPVSALKFDFKIAPSGRRLPAKGRNAPHSVIELFLDKPADIGNMTACHVVGVSLLTGEVGDVTTRRSSGNRESAGQSASVRAGHREGEWNEMEIRCGEKQIQVLINGVEVNRVETQRKIVARAAFSFGNIELHLANLRLR